MYCIYMYMEERRIEDEEKKRSEEEEEKVCERTWWNVAGQMGEEWDVTMLM